jgi:hypothetical protein
MKTSKKELFYDDFSKDWEDRINNFKTDYFNFLYPGKFLNQFEKCGLLKYLMINFGYLAKK